MINEKVLVRCPNYLYVHKLKLKQEYTKRFL